ncbi:MAG: Rieske 2Fe-2S domain-containing protein [Betaproteobacteria bacterium]|nr:Rieske 2Fe-2S domain-containing protein [Betaproteobacteria bacterium]MCH9849683.1 Rieske 2Fe-2S domain-containing protein [Betaproteobacteria bacterium]
MPSKTIVFDSSELQEKSHGLRFDLPHLGEHATGFVIRFDGKPHAYVNQCAHMPVELDWNEGEFFTREKDFIICATHGACYVPDTGHCAFGPCKGKQLQVLKVTEESDQVFIHLD